MKKKVKEIYEAITLENSEIEIIKDFCDIINSVYDNCVCTTDYGDILSEVQKQCALMNKDDTQVRISFERFYYNF